CVTPNAAAFDDPETGPYLHKYLAIGDIDAEDRRRLVAFARDLLNSDYAGHRLTFQLFAQSPAFAHLLAVYNNYDFSGPADLVQRYAGLSTSVVRREDTTDGAAPETSAAGEAAVGADSGEAEPA
ncbi:MAG TPA: 4-hydroxyphenylacetate 3-hydroxylase C-terminal domain-containing protein, partial [Thermoleophilia bacterium]|nr:4-hydroxyphenylacetate 3-hydroxylase C-terminal domain-containing protein [Thermoleophilia bacterium]